MNEQIWFRRPVIDELNTVARTLVGHLGIAFTAVGDDYITATMPVDERTIQPAGLLHGGASVALAETLGSMGAQFCVDAERFSVVGLEINANHVRGVRAGGTVEGTARPLHVGSRTQLWEIRIADSRGKLVCISRLTVAVLPNAAPAA